MGSCFISAGEMTEADRRVLRRRRHLIGACVQLDGKMLESLLMSRLISTEQYEILKVSLCCG